MQTIHVVEKTLPEAWQKAVLETWDNGSKFKTEYDKPNDPESRDVAALIRIVNPMQEPRIHRALPAGLNDLQKYVMEVVYGVHDHWINPDEGKWSYTYHQRLNRYETLGPNKARYNQIESVIAKLKEAGHSRRAQAITWQPWQDYNNDHPPCLQRLFFRIENDKLNMHCHIRSNDAYKAAFMNIYAFTELQKHVAEQLNVPVGEYLHFADSFHIYGSYFNEFKSSFLNLVNSRDIADLVFDTKYATPFLKDGLNELLQESDMPETQAEIIKEKMKTFGG